MVALSIFYSALWSNYIDKYQSAMQFCRTRLCILSIVLGLLGGGGFFWGGGRVYTLLTISKVITKTMILRNVLSKRIYSRWHVMLISFLSFFLTIIDIVFITDLSEVNETNPFWSHLSIGLDNVKSKKENLTSCKYYILFKENIIMKCHFCIVRQYVRNKMSPVSFLIDLCYRRILGIDKR